MRTVAGKWQSQNDTFFGNIDRAKSRLIRNTSQEYRLGLHKKFSAEW